MDSDHRGSPSLSPPQSGDTPKNSLLVTVMMEAGLPVVELGHAQRGGPDMILYIIYYMEFRARRSRGCENGAKCSNIMSFPMVTTSPA